MVEELQDGRAAGEAADFDRAEPQPRSPEEHVELLRQAAERLKQSESRFRALVHNLSDAILIVTTDGTILWETPNFTRLLGYPKGHLLGRKAFDFAHPDDLGIVAEAFVETVEKRNPGTPTEFRARAYDGSYRIVEALADNLVDQPGVDGIVVTLRDVTERRREEEQRRAMEARIQHTQKLESLGVLAGGIAHDFNNLLTGVLGHASLAQGLLEQDSPARRHIEQVRIAAQRAAELTRQLLAYSGKGQFVVQPVLLSEIVQEMTGLLEVSISKKCRMHCAIAPDLPPIQADPSQIRQVVMNLILNASEAMGDHPGTIEVRARSLYCTQESLADSYLDDTLQPGRFVCLEVQDNGCGMDESVRAKIFDPFFTTKFTGRGLGLAAVLGIIRGHHGAIQVDSTPGAGTTFRVFLPVVPSLAPDHASNAAPDRGAPPRGTVLVIDDDDTVRSLALAVLREAGYEVIDARDGRRGLELFRAHQARIRAVLLDCTTASDSDAVLEKMATASPGVGVVLTGGYAASDAAPESRGQHAGFLRKPYSPAALVETMGAAIAAAVRTQ